MLRYQIRLIVGLVIWLFAVMGYAVPKPEVAGYVTRVRGEVVSEAATGRQPLALGRVLYLGDRIVTGVDARLEARMRDGMVITLGEKTEFVVRQVAGVTPDKNNSVFELAKGVFRSVTAQTEEKSQPREPCRVETPVATIGIRGTELWGGFNLLDAGPRTLDVVMLEGKGVYVESAGKRVELKRAGEGTLVKGAGQAPSSVKAWGEKKLQAAQRTVAW